MCSVAILLSFSLVYCLFKGSEISHHGFLANYSALDLALVEAQVCDHANWMHLQSLNPFCLAFSTFSARGGGKGCQLPRVLYKLCTKLCMALTRN